MRVTDERDKRVATKFTRLLVDFAVRGELYGPAPVSQYSSQYLRIDSRNSVQQNFTDTFNRFLTHHHPP